MNRIKALGTATVITAAFATPLVAGTGVASASCATTQNVYIAPDGEAAASTTVVKQSDSCLDLNENHSDAAYLARGEYKNGSSWVKSNVGNIRLSTDSTYAVLVSNVLSGVKLRSVTESGTSAVADYHY
jgi:hypothetical protein